MPRSECGAAPPHVIARVDQKQPDGSGAESVSYVERRLRPQAARLIAVHTPGEREGDAEQRHGSDEEQAASASEAEAEHGVGRRPGDAQKPLLVSSSKLRALDERIRGLPGQ